MNLIEDLKNILKKSVVVEKKTTESDISLTLILEDVVESEKEDSCGTCHWYKEDYSGRAIIGICFRNPPNAFIKDNLSYSARPKVLANDKPCVKFKKIKT